MALYKVDSDTADLTKVAGGTLYADNPIGSILPYGGAIAPSGWFICQGQAISRTTYAELFAVIGTTFGSGNGSTTFNLPDLRNKAVMGAGTNGALGASQSAQLPNITGKIDNKSGTFGIMGFSSGTSSFSGALIGSEAKGAVYTGQQNTSACKVVTFDASHSGASTDINGNNVYTNNGETRPANVRLNFIIKAKQTPVPADFESAVDEAVGEFLNHKSANITATFSGSATISKDVTFDTPMPDTNYVVIFEGTYGNEQVLYPLVVAKSVNGFTVKITKTDETTSGSYTIKYHAFRIA